MTIADTKIVITHGVKISWIHLATSIEHYNTTGNGAQSVIHVVCYPTARRLWYVQQALSKTFWGSDVLISSYAIRWSRHCPLSSPLWFVSYWQSADRAQRRLVKNSFIVELSDGHRKLRHLFLFNDVIACAKYKVKDIMFRLQKCW
jgi:hypothetical protein